MSSTVYLIGHGRVARNDGFYVAQNTQMHWLAPIGMVTSKLSHALLAGNFNFVQGSSGAGTFINEHYLCGDQDWCHEEKLRALFNNNAAQDPHGCADPWVVFPRRDKYNIPLSSILDFFHELSPTTQRHVYWTCCRGYISEVNPVKAEMVGGAYQFTQRVNPPATPALSAQDHETVDCDFDTVVCLKRSDLFNPQQNFRSMGTVRKLLG